MLVYIERMGERVVGEQIFKTISTALGALTGYFFGGWSLMIQFLLWLVIADWVTGWAAAWINGELRSRVGYYGIARKVAIFLLVAVSHFIDMALGGLQYFQNAVIFFIWRTNCYRSSKMWDAWECRFLKCYEGP